MSGRTFEPFIGVFGGRHELAVDAQFARAIAAGGKVVKPVQDQFYGDRSGTFVDPFGHQWSVGTHVRDVTMEEMQQAMRQMGSAAKA